MNSKAFTFVEMLLGLCVFSMVSIGILDSFLFGVRIQRRAETQEILNQEADMILEQLSKDLENMIFYDFSKSYPSKIAFEGKAKGLSLILVTGSGLKNVRYYLEKDALVRTEIPFPDYLQDNEMKGATKILSSHIDSNKFGFLYAFLMKDEQNPHFIWNSVWGEKFMPAGVSVDLEISLARVGDYKLSVQKEFFIPAGIFGKQEVE